MRLVPVRLVPVRPVCPCRPAAFALLAFALVACGGTAASELRPASAHPVAASAPAPLASEVERSRVPLDYAPARGPRFAPVTVVVFNDFECPFCRRALPTLERLREAHPEQLRVVFRHFPLAMHPHAELASAAAQEAYAQGGDELFWRLHDRLFALENLDREHVLHVAEQVGVDRSRLEAALESGAHAPAIAADIELGRSLGITGTPSFFINGRLLEGALPYERFATVVDEELAVAASLRERGVADADLYTAITWGGRPALPALEAPAAEAPSFAPAPEGEGTVFRVPIDGQPPVRGPDDALVTVVIFSDFQCPFCSRVEPTLAALRQRYESDVRLVWLNNPLPFHNDAMPAAQAALEVYRQRGAEAFWHFHDVLFENQRQLGRADLERYAQAEGVDLVAFRRALDTNQHQATIEAQQTLARSLGASGTPSFFINGRKLVGAQPLARFTAVVDAALADARALVEAGVDRGEVYARTIRDGRTEPLPRPSPAPSRRDEPDPDHVYELPIPAGAPRRGARRPRVVIQEMTDLQCPFCSRVVPTLDRLMDEYGNRVQLVWRDYPLPFHQDAPLAAEAAREVKRQRGDRAFFEFVELVFQNQRELGLEKLVEYGGRIRGVNTRRLRRALEQRTHRAVVEADVAAIGDAVGSIGTPSFLIDGRMLRGAQPYEAFRDAVEAALRRQAGNGP